MARRRCVDEGQARTATGELLPEEIARYPVHAGGCSHTAEGARRWLPARARWREQHPDDALPGIDSVTRAALMRMVERGELDARVYAAERSTPVAPRKSGGA